MPFVLRHHWARTHSVDEMIVLLTIIPVTDPYVHQEKRVRAEQLSEGLVRITARFGFMEKLDISPVVAGCSAHGPRARGREHHLLRGGATSSSTAQPRPAQRLADAGFSSQ